MKSVALILIALAVMVSVRGRKKYGRDEEVDSILAENRERMNRSWRAGVIPPLDAVLLGRAERRSD